MKLILYFKKVLKSRYTETGFFGILLLYSFYNLFSNLDILLNEGIYVILKDYRFYLGVILYLLIFYFFINSFIINFGWKKKAENAYAKGEYKIAIKYYNKILKFYKWNGHFIADRGNCYYQMKDWQSAINDYTKAIKLEPDEAYIFKNRANAYKNLGFRTHSNKDIAKVKQLEQLKTR